MAENTEIEQKHKIGINPCMRRPTRQSTEHVSLNSIQLAVGDDDDGIVCY